MIRHHPSAETLLAHAAGQLPAGHALVVAAHAQGCPHCRAELARLEALGGELLDSLTPEGMALDAFTATLARLDEPPHPRRVPAKPRQANLRLPHGISLPSVLAGAEISRWLWVGPGVRYSRVRLPWAPNDNVMLLSVAANRRVIAHSHGGSEFTQVLQGSFSDETGHYGAGDMAEEDNDTNHQPRANDDGCLCLAALEGGLRLPWLTRLTRRFA
ncbi:ChrR family anti-sigma-E factor [Acidocella aminolytica]|uniref:Transcriptional regulator n=1 Tax=Acidocella aminolytica 101 = DSM 11237 TaxID=1120923 RepID=A0A0D6PD59_9PROT|nr:ChrR family anti-sigma-E factor [Acidocella aminolytica]GAN79133.1 transcriptional regulator [Acidocella aminolytica 101 = DSM 11237]GBQ43724.1 anti-sigma factor [Acidocella aminolytica 101 = DSM 11237]SHE66086.1 anti-ECFsigma factor, ChrR [Acidocella aminolytica 101 = DSM 11237]